ncbi:Stress response protein SCP2 [Williamsia sterculiae]|uniref:Stress response protein SCP2 n=2 Tax=Williamsia sterculiae TaxID=1344003 RepID=A0A1N7ENG8_9NOCA|nr:Stress response protein SCP2 [Williamsia sterculiae]
MTITVRVAFDTDDVVRPDVSALLLDDQRRVRNSGDFVFFNQPTDESGAVRIVDPSALEIEPEQLGQVDALAIDLSRVGGDVHNIVICASIDDSTPLTFTDASVISVVVNDIDNAVSQTLATYSISALDRERALMFMEFYRRGAEWKLRALGEGYAEGLGPLAVSHGVEIENEPETVGDTGTVPRPEPRGEISAGDSQPASTRKVSTASTKKPTRPPRLPQWSLGPDLAEDGEWDRARLFSVSAIGSGNERERRAVSALLAVIGGVREFGREVTRRCAAPTGQIETFIEPQFRHDDDTVRPDGLLRVRRGRKEWVALVEAKTLSNPLKADQVEKYIDLAREHGFDAVVTVSNQLPGAQDDHPVLIDKRKLRKVDLVHISWDEIRSVAIQMSMHSRIEDSTQGWVLREFVRYLQHPSSGLHGFTDMGPLWVSVRSAVKDRTLGPADKSAVEVCNQFDQLIRHIGLDLSCLLGVTVTPIFPRDRPDRTTRTQQLADSGVMFGSLRIPGATGPVTVEMDLRSERVSCAISQELPGTSRTQTKVKNLVRQIPDARPDTRIDAFTSSSSGTTPARSSLLKSLRDDPSGLDIDDGRSARRFIVTQTGPLGGRGGQSRGNVVNATNKLVAQFYKEIVQNMRVVRG